jgi:hypothetical protein
MDVDRCSVVSGEDRRRETSILSVDDPDVRLAAEALSGLGNPGQSDPEFEHTVCLVYTTANLLLGDRHLEAIETCGTSKCALWIELAQRIRDQHQPFE